MNLQDLVGDSRWVRLALQVAAGAIVLVVLAAGGWAWYRSQESRGLGALAQASALAQQAMGPQAAPEAQEKAVKALEAVIAEHPRLSGLQQAAYELGNLKYTMAQYAGARGAYELAVAKGGSASIRVLAGMGIGYTWEAEKNYASAVQAYEAVIKGLRPKDFMYEDALMAEARAQSLAGQPAAALEVYQRLLRDVPDSRYADEVRNRAASLKSRLGQ
jgi:tetratricopeptide (TPR) repeat protein